MTLGKQKERCGTCNSWHRGGLGAGRGGGWCLRWNIPKYASNDLMGECWAEKTIKESGIE